MSRTEPELIADIAVEGTMYVCLACPRCKSYPHWQGPALAARFASWPNLTLTELRDKARCRKCNGKAELTRAYGGKFGIPSTWGEMPPSKTERSE